MSTPTSGEPGQRSPRKKKTPAPAFEIVVEKPCGASLWNRLGSGAAPVVGAARNILGSAYLIAARAVLERVEALEDKRAEQVARSHRSAAPYPAAPAPAPLIEGPKLKAPRRRKPAAGRRSTSSGPRA